MDKELSDQTPEVRVEYERENEITMIEMHGRLFDVLCTSMTCKHREYNDKSPICEALAGTEALMGHGTTEPKISIEDLPRCSKCGELARPGVVWFDEKIHHSKEIGEVIHKADLCLIVGTSSVVCVIAYHAQYL